MPYIGDPEPRIKWDGPGLRAGVTIERWIDGRWYVWRIPFNGAVTQAEAALILEVSLMSVNNWVNSGKINELKTRGPSLIPMFEINRVRAILEEEGRLGTR
jgi:hypothetical protein